MRLPAILIASMLCTAAPAQVLVEGGNGTIVITRDGQTLTHEYTQPVPVRVVVREITPSRITYQPSALSRERARAYTRLPLIEAYARVLYRRCLLYGECHPRGGLSKRRGSGLADARNHVRHRHRW